MLTDAFFRRYADITLWTAYTESERRFLGQAAQLIADDMLVRNKDRYKEPKNDPAVQGHQSAHTKLARELGVPFLVSPRFTKTWKKPDGNDASMTFDRTADNQTRAYLTATIKETSSPDLFIKFRISFIELAFQERARQLVLRKASLKATLSNAGDAIALYDALTKTSWQGKEKDEIEQAEAAFAAQIHELNERFRQAKMPLTYHNDLIQMSDDALVEKELERPFWSIVSAPKWANVDHQMKEALDERDRGERNAVSNAMNALESVIKTISDDRTWTTGNEKGAANFIDNLVKERDGVRFIAVWEKDALIKLFGDIRNAFGHGPSSSQPLPTLLPEQTNWAIDTCMAWIKNLVRRHG